MAAEDQAERLDDNNENQDQKPEVGGQEDEDLGGTEGNYQNHKEDEGENQQQEKEEDTQEKKLPKSKTVVTEDYIELRRNNPYIEDFEFNYELNPVIRRFTLFNDSPYSVHV
mmetsp:Transcript_29239/g.26659  ORF Transcript_29239/g.26659 Transcript_29239/m.26659 type:complete len:112 (+) Transcript_29239:3590-3925(+)